MPMYAFLVMLAFIVCVPLVIFVAVKRSEQIVTPPYVSAAPPTAPVRVSIESALPQTPAPEPPPQPPR